MFNLYEEVEELSMQCFAIEKKLPTFFMRPDELSELQALRQRLYRVRCDLGAIQNDIRQKNLNYEI